MKTYQEWLEIVKELALYLVPEELKTKEMCIVAVEKDENALESVPIELIIKSLKEIS